MTREIIDHPQMFCWYTVATANKGICMPTTDVSNSLTISSLFSSLDFYAFNPTIKTETTRLKNSNYTICTISRFTKLNITKIILLVIQIKVYVSPKKGVLQSSNNLPNSFLLISLSNNYLLWKCKKNSKKKIIGITNSILAKQKYVSNIPQTSPIE